MPNMPTITSVEIAAVGTAVFALYVAPFLLAQIAHYRRRKAERLNAAFSPAESMPSAPPYLQEPTAAFTMRPIEEPGAQVPTAEAPLLDTHKITAAAPVEPTCEPWRTAPEEVQPDGGGTLDLPTATGCSTESAGAKRFEGDTGHRFRLEDLHRARLEDWPPATIRDDAARRQIWSEAQRVAETHPAVLSSMLISPCQVRSVCLGGAEKDGSIFRLCFLLFSGLWPVSPDQAVSQAVFEVDSATGEARHWIELLR
ncbi:MAG: hypothetical protein ACHQ9S_03115 [Candidatus Binatia bacterium]